MSKKILLCDNLFKNQSNYDLVINWNSCSEDLKTVSIPKVIEKNANQLKKQYLDWVDKLGSTKISGKSITNHLLLREDFSLWWMSLIVEKSKWKSPGMYQVFQLLALNLIIDDIDDIDIIDISITDVNAYKAIKEWCLKSKINCNLISIHITSKFKSLLNNVLNYRPHIISAVIWLILYSIRRWPRKKIILNKKIEAREGSICIISYFFNIDRKKADKNIFYTSYWTQLHDLLLKNNKPINWIHLFVKSNEFSTYDSANVLIDKLNEDRSNQESHQLIDNYLSLSIIKKTLKDYLRLIQVGTKLTNARSNFSNSNMGINFWNVLSDSWKSSLFGKSAIANCLYLNIFEKMFEEMPKQSQGLYLLENQPWEKCLIYAWRKYGHGQIIGVPHASVSYWDLRYSLHSNEHLNSNDYISPLPDNFALNGQAAINMYVESGLPSDRVKKVEALRYLYLSNLKTMPRTIVDEGINLLVLGGHDFQSTRTQMELLINCMELIDREVNILVKPHPLSIIKESDYPNLNFQVTLSPLYELISKYNVVFCSNQTAAAVDVYLSQKKVLIMQDCNTFNMSALRGFNGVKFIQTPKELAGCLSENANNSCMLADQDFFFLDNELPKWRKLLNIE